MGVSRKEYWGGLPWFPPGGLPNTGMEPASPLAPALQVDSLELSHQRRPMVSLHTAHLPKLGV